MTLNNNSPQPSAREWRYVLRDSPEVTVTVRWGLWEDTRVHHARLFDLSQHGAKLLSSEPISVDEGIRLELEIEEMGLAFYVAGSVCWSKPAEGDTWMFGCSLQPGLPEGVFDALAKGGNVDRRFDPRLERQLDLEALWDLNDDVTRVMLQDFSRGGFCIWTDQAGNPGGRLHLRFSEPSNLMVVAKAMWQLKVVDGYLVGCSFLNERDFDRLQAVAARQLAEHELSP